jgi:hypothetical protein
VTTQTRTLEAWEAAREALASVEFILAQPRTPDDPVATLNDVAAIVGRAQQAVFMAGVRPPSKEALGRALSYLRGEPPEEARP